MNLSNPTGQRNADDTANDRANEQTRSPKSVAPD
jgi:hypothetical protein